MLVQRVPGLRQEIFEETSCRGFGIPVALWCLKEEHVSNEQVDKQVTWLNNSLVSLAKDS